MALQYEDAPPWGVPSITLWYWFALAWLTESEAENSSAEESVLAENSSAEESVLTVKPKSLNKSSDDSPTIDYGLLTPHPSL
jgi:hypothetical protein